MVPRGRCRSPYPILQYLMKDDPQTPELKTVSLFPLDLEKRRANFEAANGKGIEHEFQLLGKELEPI